MTTLSLGHAWIDLRAFYVDFFYAPVISFFSLLILLLFSSYFHFHFLFFYFFSVGAGTVKCQVPFNSSTRKLCVPATLFPFFFFLVLYCAAIERVSPGRIKTRTFNTKCWLIYIRWLHGSVYWQVLCDIFPWLIVKGHWKWWYEKQFYWI